MQCHLAGGQADRLRDRSNHGHGTATVTWQRKAQSATDPRGQRPDRSFHCPALMSDPKSLSQWASVTHLPAVNINTNALAQYQLHVGWMAELDSHPHDEKHPLVHGGAFTQLRAAVHGRIPGGFRFHLQRRWQGWSHLLLLKHRTSQGNILAWPKGNRPVTRAVLPAAWPGRPRNLGMWPQVPTWAGTEQDVPGWQRKCIYFEKYSNGKL